MNHDLLVAMFRVDSGPFDLISATIDFSLSSDTEVGDPTGPQLTSEDLHGQRPLGFLPQYLHLAIAFPAS